MSDKDFDKYELEKWIKKSMNVFEEELPMLIDELIDTPEAPKQTVGKRTAHMADNRIYDFSLVIMQRFIE